MIVFMVLIEYNEKIKFLLKEIVPKLKFYIENMSNEKIIFRLISSDDYQCDDHKYIGLIKWNNVVRT